MSKGSLHLINTAQGYVLKVENFFFFITVLVMKKCAFKEDSVKKNYMYITKKLNVFKV